MVCAVGRPQPNCINFIISGVKVPSPKQDQTWHIVSMSETFFNVIDSKLKLDAYFLTKFVNFMTQTWGFGHESRAEVVKIDFLISTIPILFEFFILDKADKNFQHQES
jgi:hypothetical protein